MPIFDLVVFGLHTKSKEYILMESVIDISSLITTGSFFNEYQPLWNTETETIFAYEALLRTEPRINPLLVFKHGREEGLLYEFDTASILNSIREYPLYYWEEYLLFVNIFPSTIIHPMFPEFIEGLVKEFPMLKERVVFEINEDSFEDKYWDKKEFVNGILFLKNTGLLIALDDLPLTPNSLRKISKIKPHFTKLDRSCSENLSKSKEKQKNIESFLAESTEDSVVVLEGIEKKEDLIAACRLGIPAVQGYYISKPHRL